MLTSTSCAPGGKAATVLVASAARHVFEHMDRRSAISPKRGELLGNGRILPPGSVEGYPSLEEPPTYEASKDILHPRNLRANAMRRILRKTNVDDSFCRAKCMQGLRHPRRLTSRERRNLRSSQVRGWRGTRRRRGTSDTSRLRNLRRGSVGGSVAKVAGEPLE